MAEEIEHGFDATREARGVLQRAVADYGRAVLTNPVIIEGICEDRLPEWPREASLISIAAQADVAGMLQQQTGGVGPDTAVRLTASDFARTRSLDPAAGLWVVGEFARALGYEVSEDLAPIAVRPDPPTAEPAPPPVTNLPVDAPVSPAAPLGPDVGADSVTILPDGSVTRSQLASEPGTDQGPSYEDSETHLGPGVALAVPVAGGTGATPPVFPPPSQVPASGGYVPPGNGPGGGYRPPGGSRSRLTRGTGIGLVVLVIAVYFIVAGAASLPPFGKSKTTTTTTTTTTTNKNTKNKKTTTTKTTLATTPNYVTLAALIPSNVEQTFGCTYNGDRDFAQATAQITCSTSQNISPSGVTYVLFQTTGAVNHAYNADLGSAGISRTTGSCNATTYTAPCETTWTTAGTPAGRIVEQTVQGQPNVVVTVTGQDLLVDMSGSTGNDLITWWKTSPNWLNGGT